MPVLRCMLVLGLFIVSTPIHTHAQDTLKPVIQIPSKEKNAKFIKEFSYTLSSNSNVIIGTETRAKLDPTHDTISHLNATLGFYRQYPNKGEIYGLYSLDLINHDRVDFLRARHHSLTVSGEKYFGLQTTLRVRGNLKFFDYYNLKELSFFHNTLQVTVERVTNYGLMYELAAMVGSRSFPHGISNITGYALVNSTQAQFTSRIKYWQTPWLRLGLRYSLFLDKYDGTESTYLNTLSGLTPEVGRRDWLHALQPEVTFVPLKAWVLTLGYQFQYNISNSDYYKFRGHTVFVQSTVRFNQNHSLFVEASYGDFSYYLRQFDERYLNSKEDFRTSFKVNYQVRMMEFLYLEAQYFHFANDSNDSIDFNPLTSRSYSTFTQNVFNIGFRFDMTDLDIF